MEQLTGIQVLITSFNGEDHLQESLDSILPAVEKHPWSFIFVSDGSTDNTFQIAQDFAKTCGADHTVVKDLKKSVNVSKAKNRTFKYINKFRKDYPYICVHDDDDLMGKDRISQLSKYLDAGKEFVFGDFIYDTRSDESYTVSANSINGLLKFGVWNTLFHEKLVPKSGKFYDEDLEVFEDLVKWWKLRYNNKVDLLPVDGVVTTHYIKHEQSMTKVPVDSKHIVKLKEYRNRYEAYPPIT